MESSPEQPGALESGVIVVGPDAVDEDAGETNAADARRGLRERLGIVERLGVSERAAFWLGIAAIVAVAAILRLVNLSTRGTWDADQGHDMLVLRDLVQRGQVPLLGPPTSIGDFHHGVLYYFLLAPAAALSGADPTGVTLAIALAGIAAVAVTAWLGRAIGGTAAGLVAGLLMAVSASADRRVDLHLEPEPDRPVQLDRAGGGVACLAGPPAALVDRGRCRRDRDDAPARPGGRPDAGDRGPARGGSRAPTSGRRSGRDTGGRERHRLVDRAGGGQLRAARDPRGPERRVRAARRRGVPDGRWRTGRDRAPGPDPDRRPARARLAAHRPDHRGADRDAVVLGPRRGPRRLARLARPAADRRGGRRADRHPLARARARLDDRRPWRSAPRASRRSCSACRTTTTTRSPTRWCSSSSGWGSRRSSGSPDRAARTRPEAILDQAAAISAAVLVVVLVGWNLSISRRRSRPTVAGRRPGSPRCGSSIATGGKPVTLESLPAVKIRRCRAVPARAGRAGDRRRRGTVLGTGRAGPRDPLRPAVPRVDRRRLRRPGRGPARAPDQRRRGHRRP